MKEGIEMNYLDGKFQHKHWFIREVISRKDFLDYVLKNKSAFGIDYKLNYSSNLLEQPKVKYFRLYDDDGRYTYRLHKEELKYLYDNWEEMQGNQMYKNYLQLE